MSHKTGPNGSQSGGAVHHAGLITAPRAASALPVEAAPAPGSSPVLLIATDNVIHPPTERRATLPTKVHGFSLDYSRCTLIKMKKHFIMYSAL